MTSNTQPPALTEADLERELALVREQLATRAWSGHVTGSPADKRQFRRIVVSALAGAAALLPLLLALIALAEQEWAVAIFFLVLTAGFGKLFQLSLGPTSRAIRSGSQERNALLAREQWLVAQLAAVSAQAPAAGASATPGFRADRQPSSYAQMMHARFPLGPSPEKALRTLPDDAAAWRVAFHRHVGWGFVAALTVGSAVLFPIALRGVLG